MTNTSYVIKKDNLNREQLFQEIKDLRETGKRYFAPIPKFDWNHLSTKGYFKVKATENILKVEDKKNHKNFYFYRVFEVPETVNVLSEPFGI